MDSKDYSMSAYRRFAEKMREKAEQLSKDYAKTGKLLDNAGWLFWRYGLLTFNDGCPDAGNRMRARDVEMALWSECIAEQATAVSKKSTKRKR